ncbi:hypothetical protein [Amycolatopsis coloradensis]|uniref:hypothetical protein n=1 Tax=Amycolatopsis coloradensis TaxID=76021 RepID=UPI0013017327|nr:hypothetical protein [Amycolatopsis coloradensis]
MTRLTVQLNCLGDVVTIGINLPTDRVPAIAEAKKDHERYVRYWNNEKRRSS